MEARGAFINLYRAMAHSPVALRRFYDLVACLWSGDLNDRLREIAILSVVSTSNAPYPLGWHVLDAQEAGLTALEVRAVIRGDDALLSPGEAAVARFARALTLDARVSDETFQAVAVPMGNQQIVELTMLVGFYRLVACLANGLNVDFDAEPAQALHDIRSDET